jgi:acetylornithine/N-succinyldiaminopimelate aminotransferase
LLALGLGNGGNAGAVSDKALELGLLLNAPRPDSLRFMPALNVSFSEIDQMLEILDDVLSQI